jgi:hypothetical protein
MAAEIDIHCPPISNLFVRALETERESLASFSGLFRDECTYIVFILQCQKAPKQLSNCLRE